MTEELKKEAEKYIIGQRQHYTMDFDEVHRLVVGFADYVTKELQEQIEEMKCVQNCEFGYDGQYENNCHKDYSRECNKDCKNCKDWKLKE